MDSQQEYEALLNKWGFDTESQNTAHKLYELGQKINQATFKIISSVKYLLNTKPQTLQLGLNQ